ncbi:hypothetical protein [Burkholderia pyrrocinia]|uniref:hypothetical protein n=1 Tax=Burkholderia pyrrocinia TaxID=60550 RepID=UPI00137527B8
MSLILLNRVARSDAANRASRRHDLPWVDSFTDQMGPARQPRIDRAGAAARFQ